MQAKKEFVNMVGEYDKTSSRKMEAELRPMNEKQHRAWRIYTEGDEVVNRVCTHHEFSKLGNSLG